MVLDKDKKTEVIENFGASHADTGSTEVQIALLTERIRYLTTHMQAHRKDKHSQRGLLKIVAKRKKLLRYLHGKNLESYLAVTEKLGIRRNL